MYRMGDMATWHEHRRDLLREPEDARLTRNVKEARPEGGWDTGLPLRGSHPIRVRVSSRPLPHPYYTLAQKALRRETGEKATLLV